VVDMDASAGKGGWSIATLQEDVSYRIKAAFYWHGLLCATYPFKVITAAATVAALFRWVGVLCSVPFPPLLLLLLLFLIARVLDASVRGGSGCTHGMGTLLQIVPYSLHRYWVPGGGGAAFFLSGW
jgi:hypothetical protein